MRTVAAGILMAGALVVAPAPAQAATTCNGLAVTHQGTDGNDTIIATAGNDVIAAGAGHDLISGLAGRDTVCAGPGDDVVVGGAGADTMVADAVPDGRDTFDGGFNPDGECCDRVTYAARTTPVVVSLNGFPGDGAPGEGDDNGSDVHIVIGGSADDTLIGNGLVNLIDGGPGNDRLEGRTDNDSLVGGAGDDTLLGKEDDDKLVGGAGDDSLVGGLGDDSLVGDAGNDRLIGNVGNDFAQGLDGDDTFFAASDVDGSDSFVGGAGIDTANYVGRNNRGRGVDLTLSLDGIADDGEPGERDNIRADVENVTGGTGRNVITGNRSPNVLTGGDSGDIIRGADGIGNDRIDGRFGTDLCTFDAGDVVDNCEL